MKFALITEGPSEHRIVKHIIFKYFRGNDPEINQIQPKIVNQKQQTPGGWNEVLKYCERKELADILIENDYLVIQIDTDQSQTKPFDISHTNPDNNSKSDEDLYTDVIDKLTGLIIPEILVKYRNRIFFAICIHTIECWLLPIYFRNKHKSDTRNCLATLNVELRKQNIRSIPLKNKNTANSINSYETVLKSWSRKKSIIDSARYNTGFMKFIEELNGIEGLE